MSAGDRPQQSWTAAIGTWAVLAIALVALQAPQFAGYIGGGGDDWYYVEAARCVGGDGRCVPSTHWATRYPLIAPMAAVFLSFGISAATAALVPLTYALVALAAFVRLVGRHWGAATAAVGGLALIATATFSRAVLQPNVDVVELAMLLLAAVCADHGLRRGRAAWFAVAGGFVALAIQTRMTGVVVVPIVALCVIARPQLRVLIVPFGAGLALPLLAEAAVRWTTAGDALLSWRLALAHGKLPSSELSSTVDTTRSPLFNPAFIGGWRPAADIAAHWSVQGVLNLLAHPMIGPVLLSALAMLWLRRRSLGQQPVVVILAMIACLYVGALIYALAIDPKPRVFMPVAAIACAIFARCAVDAWQEHDRLIPAVLGAFIVATGVTTAGVRVRPAAAAPLAAHWARAAGEPIAVAVHTRRFLAFEPDVYRLPEQDGRYDRLLQLDQHRCSLSSTPTQRWTVIREARFEQNGETMWLCELSRARPGRAASPLPPASRPPRPAA